MSDKKVFEGSVRCVDGKQIVYRAESFDGVHTTCSVHDIDGNPVMITPSIVALIDADIKIMQEKSSRSPKPVNPYAENPHYYPPDLSRLMRGDPIRPLPRDLIDGPTIEPAPTDGDPYEPPPVNPRPGFSDTLNDYLANADMVGMWKPLKAKAGMRKPTKSGPVSVGGLSTTMADKIKNDTRYQLLKKASDEIKKQTGFEFMYEVREVSSGMIECVCRSRKNAYGQVYCYEKGIVFPLDVLATTVCEWFVVETHFQTIELAKELYV